MGRPLASEANKSAALSFAILVTEKVEDLASVIARSGQCSIFGLLKDIFPEIVRENESGPRTGISEAEYIKLLQVSRWCFMVYTMRRF